MHYPSGLNTDTAESHQIGTHGLILPSEYPRLVNPQQNIVMFGIQGAGKGTHGEHRLVPREKYSVFGASAEMKKHRLYSEAESYIERGEMVPDHIVLTVLREYLDVRNSVASALMNGSQDEALRTIFDGIPRKLSQFDPFDELLAEYNRHPAVAVKLDISDDTARASIRNRGTRTGRSDDLDSVAVTNRLTAYHNETEPVIDRYASQNRLVIVNATPDVDYDDPETTEAQFQAAFEDVYKRVVHALNTRS